jgi:hypothetical protein
MIVELYFTACSLMNFGCDLPPPGVEYVSREWLQERACVVRRCNRITIWGWMNDTGVIYIWKDAPPGPYLDGIIVHELMHHIQHLRGWPIDRCEREREAYALQDRYLLEQRYTLPGPHPRC